MREMIWLLLPAFLLMAAITALDGPAPELRLELDGHSLLTNKIERAEEAARQRAYYGQSYNHVPQDASIPADADGRFASVQAQSQQLAVDLEQSLRSVIADIQQASKQLVVSIWQRLEDA